MSSSAFHQFMILCVGGAHDLLQDIRVGWYLVNCLYHCNGYLVLNLLKHNERKATKRWLWSALFLSINMRTRTKSKWLLNFKVNDHPDAPIFRPARHNNKKTRTWTTDESMLHTGPEWPPMKENYLSQHWPPLTTPDHHMLTHSFAKKASFFVPI